MTSQGSTPSNRKCMVPLIRNPWPLTDASPTFNHTLLHRSRHQLFRMRRKEKMGECWSWMRGGVRRHLSHCIHMLSRYIGTFSIGLRVWGHKIGEFCAASGGACGYCSLCLRWFSLLQKEGTQTGQPCTRTEIKHVSVGSDEVDIQQGRDTGALERCRMGSTCLDAVGAR